MSDMLHEAKAVQRRERSDAAQNRQRLLSGDVADAFFAAVLKQGRQRGKAKRDGVTSAIFLVIAKQQRFCRSRRGLGRR